MMQALRNYVIVLLTKDSEAVTPGGIIIPGEGGNPFLTGVVQSVGPGTPIQGTTLFDCPGFLAGETVVFGKGMGMPYTQNGDKFCLLLIEEIAAVIMPDEPTVSVPDTK
jgi:co-chaperonin GroES (HSP10)